MYELSSRILDFIKSLCSFSLYLFYLLCYPAMLLREIQCISPTSFLQVVSFIVFSQVSMPQILLYLVLCFCICFSLSLFKIFCCIIYFLPFLTISFQLNLFFNNIQLEFIKFQVTSFFFYKRKDPSLPFLLVYFVMFTVYFIVHSYIFS